jgi:hypothetical protein
MRRWFCITVVLCFVLAAPMPAQVGPALALFPIVMKFIGHFLHVTPSTPSGQPSVQETPGIVIEIPNAAVHPAKQLCQNWTWAASVESMLAPTGVPLTQDDMVTRAEGGSVCKDRNPNFERMTRVLDGTYYLDDGHKVRVETRNVTGAPTVIDDILMSMKTQHPLILFWKGHAYLLKGVVYSEFLISSNGARVFEINELKLLDPTATKAEEREVSFLRDRDDANEIDGVMDVRVTPEDGQSWLHPETEYGKNHQSPAERPLPPLAPPPRTIN